MKTQKWSRRIIAGWSDKDGKKLGVVRMAYGTIEVFSFVSQGNIFESKIGEG